MRVANDATNSKKLQQMMVTQRALRPDFAPTRNERCFCGSGDRFRNCCGSRTKDRPPPHGVEIVSTFLDADRCRVWSDYLERQPRQRLGTVEAREDHFETTYDVDRITDVVKAGELRGEINGEIERAFRTVIAPLCERPFAWFEYPQVLRYEPGGWYRAHADSEVFVQDQQSWAKGIDRDISLLLYLNDEFRGGSLSFLNFNYSYRPRRGDLVVFPSDHRYAHQAEPVEQGLRWVVASWGAFANEPRVRSEPAPESIVL